MRRGLHLLGALTAAAAMMLLALGCHGITQNPSEFPYFLPFGDSIQTHGKPPGKGYFKNFDPYACRLEVRPKEVSLGVGQSRSSVSAL